MSQGVTAGVNLTIPLPVQRHVLVFDATSAIPAAGGLPAFAGNSWRGALGHSLRALACLTGAAACTGCTRKAGCAYNYLWETPPPADATRMRLYPQAPHPFILRELTPAAGAAASGTRLMLTLVGRADGLLPLVVQALALAARGAHGIAGRQLRLREVLQENTLGALDWQRIDGLGGVLSPRATAAAYCPAAPSQPVRLMLQTPLRIKKEGRAVAPHQLAFADFFGALLRRISMLCAFHTEAPLEAAFAELMLAARAVLIRSELAWERQQRFSNRQKRAMPMDGVIGWIELDPAHTAAFWPYLWLGQFVHAGSAATMGLGCYSIEDGVPAPARRHLPSGASASLPDQTAFA